MGTKIETFARGVGGFLGVLLGVLTVFHFHRGEQATVQHVDNAQVGQDSIKPNPIVADHKQKELAREKEVAELQKLAKAQAAELARLRAREELSRVLDAILHPKQDTSSTSAEVLRLAALSPDDLSAEIKVAVNEVAAYTDEDVYAPERHAELHRRVNTLYSIKGLSGKQNDWLLQAVRKLNDLAVRHAESAFEKKDVVSLARTVDILSGWSFRLTTKQRERLVTIIEAIQRSA